MNNEQIAFTIISNAGDGKSQMFEALNLARKGKFNKAKEKVEEANNSLNKAHDQQTDLLTKEAQGEKRETDLLLIHAQDHLMSAMLTKDLIEEMIKTQKQLQKLKDNK